MKERSRKKTQSNIAVDDEADIERAIKGRRGRAGGHEGDGGNWDGARGEQTLES